MTLSTTKAERLWRAVLSRDSRMDGAFVYAVRSTGVYCRPSCPSRRPNRSQVAFFRTADEAQKCGFRACRRCWARQEARAAESALVARLCRVLEREDAPQGRGDAIRKVATDAGFSTGHLRRVFQRLMGVTPRGYADQARLRRLKHRLRKEEDVTTAMYASGYGSSSRLYERSNTQLGMTPATYGRGGRGMEIRYTVSPSPIGRILVAGTDRGVSAIYMGRSDVELTATLRREYPEAQISRNPESVSRWVRQIVRHLAGRHPELDLPLDIQGTAFQRRVWEALRRIPYGETRSYTDVARQLGQPKARRAVARACATNPVSLVIPCHRVIRGDGGLGGYGGGIERKQALLETERRAAKKH
jgi:AraC family transcriptional regulator, regulatory protein of adaptative response / methylated-DNA-[protein]-cysteine methyltransferase